MTFQLRAMGAADIDLVSRFLLKVNRLDENVNFLPESMRWKYLEPRPDWSGTSRGFLLEKAGRVFAFGGVLPARLGLPDGRNVNSGTLIDWAADSSMPGAGVILMN